MAEYTKISKRKFRAIESNPKVANQPPISEILQTYNERSFPTVQREAVEGDELLQGKFMKIIETQYINQGVMQFAMKGYAIPGQKGTFIGNPAAIHIHIVKDNTHLQLGSEKYFFDEQNADKDMTDAYQQLLAQGKGKPGYNECLAAFEAELGIAKTDIIGDDDDTERDDSRRYSKWTGYMRTDRYGIPINQD